MKHTYLVGGLYAVASMTAQAAIPAFEALDTDGNGVISQVEATKSEDVMAAFVNADKNEDGSLSPEEYKTLL